MYDKFSGLIRAANRRLATLSDPSEPWGVDRSDLRYYVGLVFAERVTAIFEPRENSLPLRTISLVIER